MLVSACLLGLNTKYNGCHNLMDDVVTLKNKLPLIPVCPEQLGGLCTPRSSAEIRGGDGLDVLAGRAQVLTNDGEDRTESFLRGAYEVLRLAKVLEVSTALLKARSPSCGNCRIYDGSFSGSTRDGSGVTAALLKSDGIAVFNETQLDELLLYLEGGSC
jgi:uncharacterized protein YbbK (DUF523 family)